MIVRFRRVAWGRLYWKRARASWKRFDSDDICVVKNGGVTIHYKTLDALERDIKRAEGFIQ